MQPAWLDLEGTNNVRDVGGLATAAGRRARTGVLLRSDHLENLTDAGANRLLAETGLRLVVDLRSPAERPQPGSWAAGPAGGGMVRLSLPMVDLTQTTNAVQALTRDRALAEVDRLVATYRIMLDAAGPSLGRLIVHLTESPDRLPALIHCAAGKDRTGIAVAVLLRAAGIKDADIVADYVATGERLPRIRAALAARPGGHYPPQVDADGAPLPDAPMLAVLQALDDAGGVAAFLGAHGVGVDVLERWRELLLEAE